MVLRISRADNLPKWLFRLTCLAILFGPIPYLGSKHLSGAVQPEDPLRLPPLVEMPPEAINVIFLGHRQVYKDFLNIWLVGAMVDEKNRRPNEMRHLLKLAFTHKINSEALYMLACFSMIRVHFSPDDCSWILDEGIKVFPNSFRLPMTAGFVYAFLLNRPSEAARMYRHAGNLPEAPTYVSAIATKISNGEILDQTQQRSLWDEALGPKDNNSLRRMLEIPDSP